MSHSRRRLMVRLLAASLLGGALVALVPPVSGRSAPRTVVRFRDVALGSLLPAGIPAVRGPEGSVRLIRTAWSRPGVACSSQPFTMAGLVWRQEGGSEVETEVSWGGNEATAADPHAPMARLHAEPGEGPDPGSPDDAGIAGTPPVWTGGSRCLGFRLRLPANDSLGSLRAVFVETSDGSGDGVTAAITRAWRSVAGVWGFLAPSPAEAWTEQPGIVTREEWGADESIRRCGPYYADRLKMAYVHHTAGSNAYSPSEADDLLRGIYAYHVRGRGFCDIAYNFLIDKFGRIYEGRYGGMAQPLIGGHAMGFNTGSTGVAAIGNFTSVSPSREMLAAFKRLLAWRLDVAHLPPMGTTRMVSAGGSTTKYAEGEVVRLPVIAGHRDTGYTSCPARLYDRLGEIRRAAHRIGLPKIFRPSQSVEGIDPGATSVRYRASLSASLDWHVDVLDAAGTRIRRFSGQGERVSATWDGTADGSPVPEGEYRVVLRAMRPGGARARPARFTVRACTAVGTGGDDVLAGAPGPDVLCGLGGDDVLAGGGGDDLLVGGDGLDVADLSAASGPVSVDLAAGTASGQGTDTLVEMEGAVGSAFGDSLVGGPGDDVLSGGDGDDRLVGGAGDDVLRGGLGTDLVDYSEAGSAVRVDLADRRATGEGADVLAGIENLTGSPFGDTITGDNGANSLEGLGGPDTIRGRGGDDVLSGSAGDDRLYGGSGNDVLDGGARADTLVGGAGLDQMAGGTGSDTLLAADGEADVVDGGDGTDAARVDEELDQVTAVESFL